MLCCHVELKLAIIYSTFRPFSCYLKNSNFAENSRFTNTSYFGVSKFCSHYTQNSFSALPNYLFSANHFVKNRQRGLHNRQKKKRTNSPVNAAKYWKIGFFSFTFELTPAEIFIANCVLIHPSKIFHQHHFTVCSAILKTLLIFLHDIRLSGGSRMNRTDSLSALNSWWQENNRAR